MKSSTVIPKTLRIIFFGTPDFAVPALEALAKHEGYEIFAVTAPARPAGRAQVITAPPVRVSADRLGLLTMQPETLRDAEFAKKIVLLKPDIFVVAAYGKILPQELLALPRYGALNIHPSLLPKYRGPSPIESAILNGEAETGVSIMQMDAEIDHGPVLAQEIVPLAGDETLVSLSKKLAKIGARLLLDTLPDWITGAISPVQQNHDAATRTKILTREDGRLFWDNPAVVLERQVRAYAGWPESYFVWQRNGESLRVKVERARAVEGGGRPIGTVGQKAGMPIVIETLDGALAVDLLKLEGKSSTTAAEFVNGYPDIIGARML